MKKIKTILADETFTQWYRENDRLQRLQMTIDQVLVDNGICDAGCHLTAWRENRVYLVVDSSAVAARIRQILPTLQRILNHHDFPVEDIHLSRFRQ